LSGVACSSAIASATAEAKTEALAKVDGDSLCLLSIARSAAEGHSCEGRNPLSTIDQLLDKIITACESIRP